MFRVILADVCNQAQCIQHCGYCLGLPGCENSQKTHRVNFRGSPAKLAQTRCAPVKDAGLEFRKLVTCLSSRSNCSDVVWMSTITCGTPHSQPVSLSAFQSLLARPLACYGLILCAFYSFQQQMRVLTTDCSFHGLTHRSIGLVSCRRHFKRSCTQNSEQNVHFMTDYVWEQMWKGTP